MNIKVITAAVLMSAIVSPSQATPITFDCDTQKIDCPH